MLVSLALDVVSSAIAAAATEGTIATIAISRFIEAPPSLDSPNSPAKVRAVAGQKFAPAQVPPQTGAVPVPPTKRPRRRCVLCGISELAEAPGYGKFLLVPDPNGR